MEVPSDPPHNNGANGEPHGTGNGFTSAGKPPLGRHVSAGEKPLKLGPRQESVGVTDTARTSHSPEEKATKAVATKAEAPSPMEEDVKQAAPVPVAASAQPSVKLPASAPVTSTPVEASVAAAVKSTPPPVQQPENQKPALLDTPSRPTELPVAQENGNDDGDVKMTEASSETPVSATLNTSIDNKVATTSQAANAASPPPVAPSSGNTDAVLQQASSVKKAPTPLVPGSSAAAAAAPAVPAPTASMAPPPAVPMQNSSSPPTGPKRPKAAAPAPSGGGGGGMKELRVEDALLYLDDVKREFGDRPRVYNEFLSIMKNFKSQEVDTPGVIDKVSKLFRGYNTLILGFNKFLPDGYKITTEDLQIQDAKYAREEEALRQQEQQQQVPVARAPQPSGMGQQTANAGARPMGGGIGIGQQQHQQPVAQQSLPQGAHAPMKFPPASSMPPQRGVASLPTQQQQMATSQQRAAPAPSPRQQLPLPGSRNRAKAARPQQQQQQQAQAPPAQPPQQQQASQQQQPQHQAVEFDHAISYVTTIKRRFANDPSTYHSFLEILHTYQKEQRGIKEVLEQVARLFQDHPDLLKEFTFFLPDAVQEQAKERLHRAAADSEARQAAAQRAAMQKEQQQQQQQPMEVDGRTQKFIDMTSQNMAGAPSQAEQASRGRKRSHNEPKDHAPTPIALPQQPETYVYNSAVERQFFDSAKEALASYTRDGGQAWAEFLKCLDMYAQEILSRNEMLNFVEPLLGKRNTKLFEEFKRILGAAGSAAGPFPSMEDSWHSVPLSEIDFSRCRRCSPSYRALPRDYPAPPSTGRGDIENKVLNNVWVSLPVGSEESYTFRHMRRNTFEEMLFRCEDERFEIDMVIDSNTCTLARLEPIAEEIAQLAENELIIPETGSTPRPASADQGLGGKRYQYTFDKSILGVIHRNSIARLYGDAGQEMLDLIVKNPTVAVPVVIERLRQKDKEWRRARERLNRQWKDMAEQNYYKSLDHRSLYWRTTDKRAISTRTLLAEIKDRAANGGKEGHAALQARMDKAKEEHGGFYQVTMKNAISRDLDLTYLPKPDRRLFTPHMSLMFENNNWVHRDAFRILSFAVERGGINPTDKERIHRLWTDFLGPWFNLSTNWMLVPAASYQESSNKNVAMKVDKIASEEGEVATGENGVGNAAAALTKDVTMKNAAENSKQPPAFMDHHPLPPGATVSTLLGEGQIIKFRRSDSTYIVRLPFGTAFLCPSAILCSILGPEKSAYTSQLRAKDTSKLQRPDDQLAIGTQNLYLFFRLYGILVSRLGVAHELAYNVKDNSALQSLVEQMPGDDAAALGRKRYDSVLSLIYALLDGGTHGSAAEGGKFEDRVRSLLGHGGFALATMDKLISHILKNMQSMVNDDTMWNLMQLYRRHADAGGFKPEAFREEAAFLSDGESMYAFQKCPIQKNRGDKCVLYIEHLGVISESEEEEGSAVEPTEPPVPKRQRRER
eukprot:scaffold24012_cov186-Cylindrotheca_fusiformis.AAC.8